MKIKMALVSGLLLSLLIGAQAGALPAESQTRNFILFFEILDYTKEMGDAVSFFLTQVLEPGDQLIIYTPVRVYGFSRTTLAQPRRDLVRGVQDKLRGDTAFCRTNYQIIMDEMKIQAREVADNIASQEDLRRSLSLYRQSLANLQSLRKVNEDLLRQVVEVFKANPGKNHAVMVYQAEFRPIPDKETMNRLRAMPTRLRLSMPGRSAPCSRRCPSPCISFTSSPRTCHCSRTSRNNPWTCTVSSARW